MQLSDDPDADWRRELYGGYLAAINEPDPDVRLVRLAAVAHPDFELVSPTYRVRGCPEVSREVGARMGAMGIGTHLVMQSIDGHHEVFRSAWVARSGDGRPLAGGLHVGIAREGRLQTLYVFVDPVAG